MTFTKGLTAVLLSLLLAFVLVGCGGEEASTGEGEAPTPEGETEEPAGGDETEQATGELPDDGLIALSHKSLDYYAFVAMQEAAKKKTEEYGWQFESAVADFDSARQMNQFVNFISKKPLAIISDPNDSEGLITAIDQARDAGIPVGVFDTPTTGGDVAFTIAFDNYKAGEMAAQEIVDRLVEKYGEAKGTVLNAYGAMSSSAWRARKEGFDAVMAEYPNITYLAMPAEGDMRLTQDAALNAIAQHGFLDAVHAPSDTPAMGLYEALKQTGHLKKVGEEGHVIFVTIDAEPIALQRVEEGYYDATINQDCVAYGEIVLEMLAEYTLQGKEVPVGTTYENDKYYWKSADIIEGEAGPHMVIDPYVIDASNVDDPTHWGNVAWNEYGIRY
ncbi:sugar ABC transporter substrate-binding protein [Alkalihalobacillus oceani]|uniref:sugar ABC transporter substrate-binding protein n=1 Tax=Halalkalibacter oceani TaxID=1653776 RepID=UPI00203DF11A|nr:sugar ABC transporter substrate-binding protein [Halalkalibacter oceani]MCM3762702.1 sugar ABC transporter substrate-binding protein [Halalkalibacter oceani]